MDQCGLWQRLAIQKTLIQMFAIYTNEFWCMELAYVDKLSKADRGIRYLLVHQDVFEKTIDNIGLKTKASNEVLRAFAQMITKQKRLQKN